MSKPNVGWVRSQNAAQPSCTKDPTGKDAEITFYKRFLPSKQPFHRASLFYRHMTWIMRDTVSSFSEMRPACPNIFALLCSSGRNQQWNHWPNSYSVFTSFRKYKEWLYWGPLKQIGMAEQRVAPSQECFHIQHRRRSILIFSTFKNTAWFELLLIALRSKLRPASQLCQKGGPEEGHPATSHSSKCFKLLGGFLLMKVFMCVD